MMLEEKSTGGAAETRKKGNVSPLLTNFPKNKKNKGEQKKKKERKIMKSSKIAHRQ